MQGQSQSQRLETKNKKFLVKAAAHCPRGASRTKTSLLGHITGFPASFPAQNNITTKLSRVKNHTEHVRSLFCRSGISTDHPEKRRVATEGHQRPTDRLAWRGVDQ